MGEKIDGKGVEPPDGGCNEGKNAEIPQQNVAVLGRGSGDGDMFPVHHPAALDYFFIGAERVGGVTALVIAAQGGVAREAHVAALLQFPQFVVGGIWLWHGQI